MKTAHWILLTGAAIVLVIVWFRSRNGGVIVIGPGGIVEPNDPVYQDDGGPTGGIA